MVPALLLAAVIIAAADDAGRSFVALLQSDPAARVPAVAAADALSCVRVRTWRAEPLDEGVAVDLLAEGTTARGRQRELPHHWRLRLVPGTSRIASVQTLEDVVAAAIADAGSDHARQELVDACFECDRGLLSAALQALVVARAFHDPSHNGQCFENLDFAARMAVESRDVTAAVGAWVALSYAGLNEKGQLAPAHEALELAEAEGDCDDVAMALLTLGNQATNHGDIDGGTRLLSRAAGLADRVDDPRRPLKALHNLAVLLASRGKIPQAVDAATSLVRLSERYGWKEGEAAASVDLADIFDSTGRYDLGAVARERAYGIFRALGNDEWAAEVLLVSGAAEDARGDLPHAIALFERGIALGRPLLQPPRLALGLGALASALARSGHFREAERRLRDATALVPDLDGTLALSAATVALARHRPGEAQALAERALQLGADRYGDLMWSAETLRGRALVALGQRAGAERAFGQAVKILEQRRRELPPDVAAREHFFARRSEPYHELIALLAAAGRTRQALATAERLKARTLIDSLHFPPRPGAPAREHELVAELARRRRLFARRKLPASEVAHAREQLDTFRTEMRWRTVAVDIDDQKPAIAAIPRGAAFVEFVVAGNATIVFVVREGRVYSRRIAVTRAELERQVNALSSAIASRRLDYNRFTASLGRLLLRPVEAWLDGAVRIYIAPDDVLWRVPFALLPLHDGQPLIARHPLAFVPSMSMISGRTSRAEKQHLVAFGNPSAFAVQAPSFAQPSLPETVAEVASIGRLYPGGEVYSAAGAGEDRFKKRAPAADVLHVAAHAVVPGDWPMESSLLLAPGGPDDGLLEAQEILDLHLHCRVAVLAGCNTAGGTFSLGEGVFGLSWAFLAAGARNAVVSQWNVDSAATQRLMVAFHRALAGGAAPPDALRRAELALRSEPAFAHPFYWAPFVVVGAGW
jgi:CHAT domain-containing protein